MWNVGLKRRRAISAKHQIARLKRSAERPPAAALRQKHGVKLIGAVARQHEDKPAPLVGERKRAGQIEQHADVNKALAVSAEPRAHVRMIGDLV